MSGGAKYTIRQTNKFLKEYVKCVKRGLPAAELDTVIRLLANGDVLPGSLRDHQLSGNYDGCRECHIRPDWLLIYRRNETELELLMCRT